MTPGMSGAPDLVLPLFSPQGHILVLAGFGNLQGQMEVWDMKKYKQVCVLLGASSWWGRGFLLLLLLVWGGQTGFVSDGSNSRTFCRRRCPNFKHRTPHTSPGVLMESTSSRRRVLRGCA